MLLANINAAYAERVKDLADISGVRSNQLVGYGLVVGLNTTGDKTKFTGQSLRAMLARLGINFPAGVDPKAKILPLWQYMLNCQLLLNQDRKLM